MALEKYFQIYDNYEIPIKMTFMQLYNIRVVFKKIYIKYEILNYCLKI